VRLTIDVDGRSEPPLELPGGSKLDLTVPVPQGAQVLRVSGRPTFVPRELTGSSDSRELSVRLAPEDPQ
jgi:hypothetical protein